MAHAKDTGEMTATEIDAAAEKGAIPPDAVAPSLAAYDFSPDGENLCRAIMKKAKIHMPEFVGGGAPVALGVYRGSGIYQLAAAGDMDTGGMPVEFYRLSRDSMWVQAGKEAKTDYFRNYEDEALAILKIDRAATVEAIARKRAKNFAGLGVPRGGKFPRFSVNPTCFSEAWSAMSSLVNLKHEKEYAHAILFTESGLLAAMEPNVMAMRANAALVPGVYGAEGALLDFDMPGWEHAVPEVKTICKPDFRVMPSPTEIPTLRENESAVGLLVGGVRLMFSLRVYSQVWMFFARANQMSPFAAARDSDGSVVFWTPFACCVAMPLRGGFDGDDISLAWHSSGPPAKGFSPLPLVWGGRRAAERERWQSAKMADWRLRQEGISDGSDASVSEESISAMHSEAAQSDGEKLARRLAERAGLTLPDESGISEIAFDLGDDCGVITAYRDSDDAVVYLSPGGEWVADDSEAQDFAREHAALLAAEAPGEDDSSSADDGIPPAPSSVQGEEKKSPRRKAKKAVAKKTAKKKKAAAKKKVRRK